VIGISNLYCGSEEPSDRLRYGRGRPEGPPRPVVVWNCTRRCNLNCLHCYSQSADREFAAELTTDEGRALLDDLASFGVPVVLFSGGEPLMREDVLLLVRHAVAAGLRAVLSTNGTLIDAGLAVSLREAGVSYAGVSLDGMERVNDEFRRSEGAFSRALAGIRACRAAGLKVGLRLTLNRRNTDELDDIFRLIRDENIPRVCFYHLVHTGRGRQIARDDLNHEGTRRALDRIIDATARLHAEGQPVQVLTVDNHADGPYLYMRMAAEGHPRARRALDLLRANGGNASGSRIGCVSWDGAVHPDQFWRTAVLGNVRERPFSEIWADESQPLLAQLRERRRHLKGRCATCGFLDLCGGNLRARAEALTGDAWAPDPACFLTDEEIAGGSVVEGRSVDGQ
jgi:radical SAM protein with 4Fe4S-binding SPASM domain